jgi:hypothetical protein
MSPASGFTFRWDVQRERIYTWLRDQGAAGFAESFKGAAMLMHGKGPGYVRFVSHALRDILNGFPAVITREDRKQVQYVHLLNRILVRWAAEKLPRGPIQGSSGALEGEAAGRFIAATISAELVQELAELLNEHEQGRVRGKDNPLTFLEACIPESAGRVDLLAMPRLQWKALQQDARQLTHENGAGCDKDDEAACADLFQRFETLLSSLAGSYYNSLENIDAILEQANS